MAEVWATLFPTLVVALLHRLVFARPEVWAIARIDEGPVVRVPCVHEHLAVHARGLTRGHPIDLLMISRVRVVAGHIDAASRPAVGCHDEVQVRAAAQSDELAARTNLISDHDGCRRVQPADLSVKQQCEPSGSTIRRHATRCAQARALCWQNIGQIASNRNLRALCVPARLRMPRDG